MRIFIHIELNKRRNIICLQCTHVIFHSLNYINSVNVISLVIFNYHIFQIVYTYEILFELKEKFVKTKIYFFIILFFNNNL
jgi:hypothetical protein